MREVGTTITTEVATTIITIEDGTVIIMAGEELGMELGGPTMIVINPIRLVTHMAHIMASRIIISHTTESFLGGSSYSVVNFPKKPLNAV